MVAALTVRSTLSDALRYRTTLSDGSSVVQLIVALVLSIALAWTLLMTGAVVSGGGGVWLNTGSTQ
jgi:hypothetical protein